MVANWSLKAKSKRRKKEEYFLKNLSVPLNNYLSKYGHIILFGDFKLSNTNKHFANLMALFNAENSVDSPICFQSEKQK